MNLGKDREQRRGVKREREERKGEEEGRRGKWEGKIGEKEKQQRKERGSREGNKNMVEKEGGEVSAHSWKQVTKFSIRNK